MGPGQCSSPCTTAIPARATSCGEQQAAPGRPLHPVQHAEGSHRPGLYLLYPSPSTTSRAGPPCLGPQHHAPMQVGPGCTAPAMLCSDCKHQPLATDPKGQQASAGVAVLPAPPVLPVHYPIVDGPNLVCPAQLSILLAVLSTQLISNLQQERNSRTYTHLLSPTSYCTYTHPPPSLISPTEHPSSAAAATPDAPRTPSFHLQPIKSSVLTIQSPRQGLPSASGSITPTLHVQHPSSSPTHNLQLSHFRLEAWCSPNQCRYCLCQARVQLPRTKENNSLSTPCAQRLLPSVCLALKFPSYTLGSTVFPT